MGWSHVCVLQVTPELPIKYSLAWEDHVSPPYTKYKKKKAKSQDVPSFLCGYYSPDFYWNSPKNRALLAIFTEKIVDIIFITLCMAIYKIESLAR